MEEKERQVEQQDADAAALAERLSLIKHKILVLSGKGGVGKSSIAACLAVDLARRGRRVGVLDIDIHGPSIPRLLGVEDGRITSGEGSLLPAWSRSGVAVMSIGLMLQGRDDAVIWRGPLKYSVIKQFLRDVDWGPLDYLIVDSPPGTGDEPLSVAQLIRDADGALIVTTPQDVSTNDVRRSIGFVRQLDLPVLGVVENMSGFVCPDCGSHVNVFGSGGGERMALEMEVPFLGKVPVDPEMVTACDNGRLTMFLSSKAPGATAFSSVAEELVKSVERQGGTAGDESEEVPKEDDNMTRKIAIPVAGGRLAEHFGHCEEFAVFDAGTPTDDIHPVEVLEAPPHQPGLLPGWLHDRGVGVVIAGGLGQRAQQLFRDRGIEVVVGARSDEPAKVVRAFLTGTLEHGKNACDH
jgi:Mrp family chromosome partitioning ATPase/predicted Fe-Mo cluster-binding NifX family protein